VTERNDPTRPDEAALAEYLKGGSPVSQRYRDVSADEVPADVDRRVLALAHAAATEKKRWRQSRWVRWSAPLALAASAVLVVSIVIESGVHQAEAPVAVQRTTPPPVAPSAERALYDLQPPPAPAPEVEESKKSATPAVTPARVDTTADVAASARRAQELVEQTARSASAQRTEERQFTPTPPAAVGTKPELAKAETPAAVQPAPAASREPYAVAADEVGEVAVTGSRARRDAAGGRGPRNTIPLQTSPRFEEDAQAAEAEAPRTPETWLEDIRELRSQGRDREADEEWKRFRRSHPHHVVPDDDPARPTE
jgi:hypothetical protein